MPGPRDQRGVRHPLVAMLALTACAVPAGATSLLAVGEGITDAPPSVLERLGVRPLPLPLNKVGVPLRWRPVDRRPVRPDPTRSRRARHGGGVHDLANWPKLMAPRVSRSLAHKARVSSTECRYCGPWGRRRAEREGPPSYQPAFTAL
ncbi:transposase family protein [Streptomyces sp. IBSBF 2507]|uniref:transposase family protein n=1 Tax=Streptomyces sp. IBSBF 2507 TaxID=2903530 RepID=UPI00351F5AE9